MADIDAYTLRINATNFALANDDGARTRDYDRADVMLVGVSRSGKTPTCLYMALQYGIFAANYPLTEDDLEAGELPRRLRAAPRKLFGTDDRAGAAATDPQRAAPGQPLRVASAGASSKCARPKRSSARYDIAVLDTTECSIEEIASRILDRKGIERRLRP